MPRTYKLLILILLLALMVLLYSGVVNFAAEEADRAEDENELTNLVSFTSEDAESVSWTFEGENGEESYQLEKQDGIWVWPQDTGYAGKR